MDEKYNRIGVVAKRNGNLQHEQVATIQFHTISVLFCTRVILGVPGANNRARGRENGVFALSSDYLPLGLRGCTRAYHLRALHVGREVGGGGGGD